jgi:transcriptional regulator with XRE-family HTH domain
MTSAVVTRFGRRVAGERRRRGWTVAELAVKAGVGTHAIGNLEHGRQGCTLDSAALLAAALEISLDGLAGPCERCGDQPPPGYTCNDCGTQGEDPQRRGGGRDG